MRAPMLKPRPPKITTRPPPPMYQSSWAVLRTMFDCQR